MLRCTGRVVRVESKPYNFEGRAGITHTVRVMVGDADFADVKYDDAPTLVLPNKGDAVDLAVVASAPGGRLAVKVRGSWTDIVGASTTPSLAAVAGSK
jgi:hypothetical protein